MFEPRCKVYKIRSHVIRCIGILLYSNDDCENSVDDFHNSVYDSLRSSDDSRIF